MTWTGGTAASTSILASPAASPASGGLLLPSAGWPWSVGTVSNIVYHSDYLGAPEGFYRTPQSETGSPAGQFCYEVEQTNISFW